MQDDLSQLEKLRRDAAECALIRDLATDKAKRALFDRRAVHLESLASQVELEDQALAGAEEVDVEHGGELRG